MRRGTVRLAIWLVCAWIAAIVVVAVLVLDAQRNALSRAERSAAAMAQVMEEHTARTFQSVALTLAGIGDAWRLSRPGVNDARFRQLLRERLEDLPYVRAIFVIGPDGRIVHDSDHPNTPAVSLADRDYFRAHREQPALQSAVSAPVLSRTPGAGWFVSVTERIGSDERFEGIVVAAMQPRYFESLYAKMGHGQEEVIALFHRDGTASRAIPPRRRTSAARSGTCRSSAASTPPRKALTPSRTGTWCPGGAW
jgi:sensor domain CHASE-containing protein